MSFYGSRKAAPSSPIAWNTFLPSVPLSHQHSTHPPGSGLNVISSMKVPLELPSLPLNYCLLSVPTASCLFPSSAASCHGWCLHLPLRAECSTKTQVSHVIVTCGINQPCEVDRSHKYLHLQLSQRGGMCPRSQAST